MSQEPKAHATARMPLSKALSPRNVLELQPFLDDVLERLIVKFEGYAETGQVGVRVSGAGAVGVVDASTLLGDSSFAQIVHLPNFFLVICGRKQCVCPKGEMAEYKVSGNSTVVFERLCRENQRTIRTSIAPNRISTSTSATTPQTMNRPRISAGMGIYFAHDACVGQGKSAPKGVVRNDSGAVVDDNAIQVSPSKKTRQAIHANSGKACCGACPDSSSDKGTTAPFPRQV